MKFNQELFSSRLTLKQRAMYLSVTDAAKEIGISKATLSRLNRGVSLPDVYTYFVCCRWLELEMDFFFKVEC
jgi:transcriptional regulator with XRE-family HTH domain